MLSLILITVLNSPHAPIVEVNINPRDIKALRVSGLHCLVSHKDIEVEVKTKESCDTIKARAEALKPKKKATEKKKKLQGWF